MNKKDLATTVAEKCGLNQAEASSAIDAILEGITDALTAGDEVKLLGFGSFYVSHRAASMGRNPRTGEAIQIKASNQPKFKASKPLKDALNR